jgi:hypothetical protein
MFYTISNFEDWRQNLGPLLQSIPFPENAVGNDKFIKLDFFLLEVI